MAENQETKNELDKKIADAISFYFKANVKGLKEPTHDISSLTLGVETASLNKEAFRAILSEFTGKRTTREGEITEEELRLYARRSQKPDMFIQLVHMCKDITPELRGSLTLKVKGSHHVKYMTPAEALTWLESGKTGRNVVKAYKIVKQNGDALQNRRMVQIFTEQPDLLRSLMFDDFYTFSELIEEDAEKPAPTEPLDEESRERSSADKDLAELAARFLLENIGDIERATILLLSRDIFHSLDESELKHEIFTIMLSYASSTHEYSLTEIGKIIAHSEDSYYLEKMLNSSFPQDVKISLLLASNINGTVIPEKLEEQLVHLYATLDSVPKNKQISDVTAATLLFKSKEGWLRSKLVEDAVGYKHSRMMALYLILDENIYDGHSSDYEKVVYAEVITSTLGRPFAESISELPASYLKKLAIQSTEDLKQEFEREHLSMIRWEERRPAISADEKLFFSWLYAKAEGQVIPHEAYEKLMDLPPVKLRRVATDSDLPEDIFVSLLNNESAELSLWAAAGYRKIEPEIVAGYFERFIQGDNKIHNETVNILFMKVIQKKVELTPQIEEQMMKINLHVEVDSESIISYNLHSNLALQLLTEKISHTFEENGGESNNLAELDFIRSNVLGLSPEAVTKLYYTARRSNTPREILATYAHLCASVDGVSGETLSSIYEDFVNFFISSSDEQEESWAVSSAFESFFLADEFNIDENMDVIIQVLNHPSTMEIYNKSTKAGLLPKQPSVELFNSVMFSGVQNGTREGVSLSPEEAEKQLSINISNSPRLIDDDILPIAYYDIVLDEHTYKNMNTKTALARSERVPADQREAVIEEYIRGYLDGSPRYSQKSDLLYEEVLWYVRKKTQDPRVEFLGRDFLLNIAARLAGVQES